jgi:MoxR-like ATPase
MRPSESGANVDTTFHALGHRRGENRCSGDRPDMSDPTTSIPATPAATSAPDLHALPDPTDPRATAEAILFEIRRVIVGQDAMLERVLVGLLSGGHLLLEGVPGLAKTLTIKTLADVLGGSFKRIQFTPDLMPSDLVGTRIYRPDRAGFDVELGPVFANFLLADEINRAPAKVQSALLEVMQEHQVTIGHETYKVPTPFLVLATENPIEADGTYPLPEAQVDRFMLKILLDYPNAADEAQIVVRSLVPPAAPREILDAAGLLRLQRSVLEVYVDPRLISYAVGLVEATRRLTYWGAPDLEDYVSYGASPRGSINLIHGARAMALLHGRRYVLPADIAALAPDVLRHRLVMSYSALAEGITPDTIVDRVLSLVPAPRLEMAVEASA